MPTLKPRIAAVSYLNTVPLVWGALHGQQQREMDVNFLLPSECADAVRSGLADIGILPVIEIARQGLEIFPGTGIACHGAVRSILLISKVPPEQIRTLACDRGSRTSVMLARVILEERYGASPVLLPPSSPQLEQMLETADAALIIGDAALAIDPASVKYMTLDLGQEWLELSGHPMVFAAWAGAPKWITPTLTTAFIDSLAFGRHHLDEIVAQESVKRGFSEAVTREYLTRYIVFDLGQAEYDGMRSFLNKAAKLEPALLDTVAENVTL